MTRTSNIIPLHTAKPFPWHDFAVVTPTPTRTQRRRAKFWKALAFLCALAVVVGALWGFSH